VQRPQGEQAGSQGALSRRAELRWLAFDYNERMPDFRDVDPRELRVPPSRPQGADPGKLQRQIAQFGPSMAGMPPPWVYEASDGVLVVYNGVTRATRIAKLSPGTLIRVEVVGKLRRAAAGDPKIGDLLP
jgi:hypothetical protein